MRRSRAGVAVLIAVCVFVAFGPALGAGFLGWDDDKNFLEMQRWRGLSPGHLSWMATTFHGGPYQPLSWLTLGIDHALWGMDPRGYHATNVLLHAASGIAVWLLARRLLPGKDAAAAAAALFFALHPLRVESVAWITERRDVLSGIFFALSLLAYLEFVPAEGRRRKLLYAASLAAFVLVLLAKASALALPLVLVVLDRWPLRRPWRGSIAEKIPFAVVAAGFAALALVGQASLPRGMRTIEEHGAVERLAQAAYAAVFYPAKTLLPLRLSPIYELPVPFDPAAPKLVVAAVLALAITATLLAARRRLPAAAAAWTSFLLLVAPVSGLVQTGPQLVADRYSYLPCMPFAVLAAGWLFARTGKLAVPAAAAIVAVLGVATWKQTRYWRDTETLFARALELDPSSAVAHRVIARAQALRGARDEAEQHYRKAIELRPDVALAHNNLGLLLLEEGRAAEAVSEFREALRVQDDYGRARANLGVALVRSGDAAEAERVLRDAARLEPGDPGVRVNLGQALLAQDREADAVVEFEAALAIHPRSSEAHGGLAQAYARLGRTELAQEHLREAQRLLRGEP